MSRIYRSTDIATTQSSGFVIICSCTKFIVSHHSLFGSITRPRKAILIAR